MCDIKTFLKKIDAIIYKAVNKRYGCFSDEHTIEFKLNKKEFSMINAFEKSLLGNDIEMFVEKYIKYCYGYYFSC